MVRIGVTLLTDLPWSQAAPRWKAVEDLGFDHAWTYDHLIWGGLVGAPWRGATPMLAAAAVVTERIELGTLVSPPNFRHPYQLFRDAQALEDVSDGRFVLGVGAGGDVDSVVLGGEPMTPRQRADRFHELVATLDALRCDDHVDLAGEHFSVVDARTAPGLDRTPLVVAANGPRALRLAARVGDGWVTTGPFRVPLEAWFAGLADSSRRLEEELATAGRDEGYRRFLLLDTTASPELPGGRVSLSSVDFFEELVGRADALGFTDVVTHWPRPEEPYAASEATLERVASEVLPRWR